MRTTYVHGVFLASLFLFLRGFFPPTPTGIRKPVVPTQPPNDGRLVFVVIDALRASFANEPEFENMHRWVATGKGHLYTAVVQIPTVTMPRIKAIISGVTPSFSDNFNNLFNMAGKTATEDSWLHTAHAANLSIEFYGDDTWLNLVDVFDRSEGVTSFYVRDYTEVDNNVTRNVNARLPSPDWDIMVLHYLGLDHIGHLAGPFSTLVPGKIREMDGILGTIFGALEPKDVLLVVGDHGMTNVGSHGGGSTDETHVPLLFASPGFSRGADHRSTTVQQVDVVPTVCGLLGLPWPSQSMGIPLHEVLVDTPVDLREIDTLAVAALCGMAENDRICDDMQGISHSDRRSRLRQVQSDLITKKSEYDHVFMFAGVAGLLLSAFVKILQSPLPADRVDWLLSILLITRSILLGSSSFVEEEHQIWFHIFPTLVILLYMSDVRRDLARKAPRKAAHNQLLQPLLILCLHRFCRSANRHGDKWSDIPALADLLTAQRKFFLMIVSVCVIQVTLRKPHILTRVALFSALTYHWLDSGGTDSRFLHLSAWCSYACCVALLATRRRQRVFEAMVVVSCVVTRVHNVPVTASLLVVLGQLQKLDLAGWKLTCTKYFMLYTIHFYLGQSNSFGTIDISMGYIGVPTYLPLAHALLIALHFTSHWLIILLSFDSDRRLAGSAESSLAATPDADSLLADTRDTGRLLGDSGDVPLTESVDPDSLLVGFQMCNVAVYALLVTCLRYHLFIWSVFAPKLVYEVGMTVFLMFYDVVR